MSVFDVIYQRFVGNIPVKGPSKIILNQDSTIAYVVGTDALTRVDTHTGTVLEAIPRPNFFGIARQPAADMAAITSPRGCSRVQMLDLQTGAQTPLLIREERAFETDEESLFAVTFHPSGQFAYAVNQTFNSVTVLEWPSGTEVATIPFQDTGYKPYAVVFHPDRALAYVLTFRQVQGRPEASWAASPAWSFLSIPNSTA